VANELTPPAQRGGPEAFQGELAPDDDHRSARYINRGVIRGGFWSVGGQVSLIIAALVATPFVIRLLGVKAYGLLALLGLLIGYGAFVDLGMGAASTKFAADAYGIGDGDGEATVIWSASLIALVPALSAALLMTAFSHSIAEGFLRLRGSLGDQATLAIRIASAGFVLKALCGVFNTTPVIRMRWALNTLIMNGTMVLQTLLVPFALWAGGGVAVAVGLEATGVGVALVANMVVTRQLQPSIWPPRISTYVLRQVTRFGINMTATGLAGLVLIEIDRLVLARMVSVAAVGYYTVAATVASLLNVIPFAIGGPLLPGFAILIASSQMDEAATLYRRALRIIGASTLPLALILVAVTRTFLRLWAGPSFVSHSSEPLFLLVVAVACNAVSSVPFSAISASGHPQRLARINVGQVVPYVGLVIVGVHFWGPTGAAAAAAVRSFVTLVLYLLAARPLTGEVHGRARTHWTSYAGLLATTAIPALFIAIADPPLVFVLAVSVVAVAIYVWWAWQCLREPEREFFRDRARLVKERVSKQAQLS
jgi:O-antigen/teichoic acid export membrane protein